MAKDSFVAVILAAGQGTRMKSELPKVLHPIAGRPMLSYPVDEARRAGASEIVLVLGHGREQVEATMRARFEDGLKVAVQERPRGTGDAVRSALPVLGEGAGRVVILYGDCPLIPAAAIEALLDPAYRAEPLVMLTSRIADPAGYGRIIRDEHARAVAIREHRDCSDFELALDEVNPGVYAIDLAFLGEAIHQLEANNDQGELYLTDVVALAAARTGGVPTIEWPMADLVGINDRAQLAAADATMRDRIARRLALSGVTIRDPRSTWIDADCMVHPDATIEPNVVLRGRTIIGSGARVDVGCVLEDVEVAEGAWLKPYTVAAESRVGQSAQAGPFSHLRAGSELGPDTRIGNFVETKKTSLGRGSKANHLAYLGDGIIGEGVNIGAGTIFCNYDGFNKHTTTLDDGAFIGSDSQLVAPVRVGKGAYVGTGTTVTMNVPDDALAVSRTRQSNKEGYASRIKARLRAKSKKPE